MGAAPLFMTKFALSICLNNRNVYKKINNFDLSD